MVQLRGSLFNWLRLQCKWAKKSLRHLVPLGADEGYQHDTTFSMISAEGVFPVHTVLLGLAVSMLHP